MQRAEQETKEKNPSVRIRESLTRRSKRTAHLLDVLQQSMQESGINETLPVGSTIFVREENRPEIRQRYGTADGIRKREPKSDQLPRESFCSRRRVSCKRQKELNDIHENNTKLIKRIMEQPESNYSVDRMRKDWRKTRSILMRLSNYPPIAESRPKSNGTSRSVRNKCTISDKPLFCSSKIYQSKSRLIFNDEEFIVSIRLDSDSLKIEAEKNGRVKMIEVERGEAIDIIQNTCGGDFVKLFTKLRYDGESIYLVCPVEDDPTPGSQERILYHSHRDKEGLSHLRIKLAQKGKGAFE